MISNGTNKILRWISITAVFLIPFVPLVISDAFLFPFISGKNFTFRILVEIAFGAWLLLALRDKTYLPKTSWILKALAIFTGLILISDLLSPNVYKSFWSNFERMEGFVTLIHLLGFFIVSSSLLNTHKLWERFFHAHIGVGLFLFLYGLLQLSHELVINQGGVRLDGTFGNATYFAIYLVFLIFFAILFLLRRNPDRLGSILGSWLIGSGLFVLYPLFTHFGKLMAFYSIYGGIPEGVAIKTFSGPFGIKLFIFALVLTIALFVIFYKSKKWSLDIKNKTAIGLYIFTIIIFLIPLYETATRGAILGLIMGIFLASLLAILFEKRAQRTRHIGVGVLSAVILLVAGFYFIRNSDFVRHNPVLTRFAEISIKDTQGGSRGYIWPMAIQGFKEKPIFGWGQESFNYVFNKYYNPAMFRQEQWFDRTHNVVLDWLIAGGVFGLVGYLSLFGIVIFYLWRKQDEEEKEKGIATREVLTGLLVAYFFHNFFVFDNLISYILFVSVIAYVHSTRGNESPFFKKLATFDSGVRDRIVFPVTVIVVIGILYFVNVPAMRAGNYLIEAMSGQKEGATKNLEYFKKAVGQNSFADSEIREQLFQKAIEVAGSPQASEELKSQFVIFTKDELLKQIAVSGNDARYLLFTGLFFDRLGFYSEALPYLEKARVASPTKHAILFETGSAYLNTGQVDKALQVFKQVYESSPDFDEARKIYAMGALYARKPEIAHAILTERYGTDIVSDERLARAYAMSGDLSQAEAVVKLLIKENPSNFMYHTLLGSIYVRSGRRVAAITEINEAVKLNPGIKDQADALIRDIQAGKSF